MITQIFPQDFQRYQSLPVLGPLMDRYAGWLHELQYTWRSTRYELRMAAQVAGYLKRRSVGRIEELTGHQGVAARCHRTPHRLESTDALFRKRRLRCLMT